MFLLKQRKNDALTSLFHRYLDFLYQNRLKKRFYMKWAREGELDSPLLPEQYCNRTLRSLLCDSTSVGYGQVNLFVLRGNKGDGRVFYIQKMVQACYEHIQHMVWERAIDEHVHFRFPVMIPESEMCDSETPSNLIDLATQCVIKQLELHQQAECRLASELIEQLGSQGKLALFFDPGANDDMSSSIQSLSSPKSDGNQPIAVFIEGPEFKPDPHGSCCCIDIAPLTKEQIVWYLMNELPEQFSLRETRTLLDQREELARILQKPEQLFMYIKYIQENVGNAKDPPSMIQIYHSFIEAGIKKAILKSQENNLPLSGETLFNYLIQRAKGGSVVNQGDADMCSECFRATEIFHYQGQDFRFEGCKHYLTARSYFKPSMRDNEIKDRLEKVLLNEPQETLNFFAGLLVEEGGSSRSSFFKHLFQHFNSPKVKTKLSAPALSLADVLIFTNQTRDECDKFIVWLGAELGRALYDRSVFEALSKMNRTLQDNTIANLLTGLYRAPQSPAQQRRIVYCFRNIKFSELPSQFVKDLCTNKGEEDDIHLKYHLLSLLIDSYPTIQGDIKKNFTALKNALSNHADPILRSGFEQLYVCVYQAPLEYATVERQQCDSELIEKMIFGTYWEQIHAVGALNGRYYPDSVSILSIINKMLNALDNVLFSLSVPDTVDPQKLKTVSCLMESICQLSDRNSKFCRQESHDDDVNALAKQLLQRLNRYVMLLLDLQVSSKVYYPLQSALKLILTGTQCLYHSDDLVHKALPTCFSSEDSLLQIFQSDPITGVEESGAAFEQHAQELEMLTQKDEIERRFREASSEELKIGPKYDFSLARLSDGTNSCNGFLIAHEDNVYCITCRHCFFVGPTATTVFYVQPDRIKITLVCQDSAVEYPATMRYPPDIRKPDSFDKYGKHDVVIYQLDGFPVRLPQLIFTLDDIILGERKVDTFQAFSFPVGRETEGRWGEGAVFKPLAHGFFAMRNNDVHMSSKDMIGFSGAPIAGVDDVIQLYGMWKGNENGTEIRGITGKTIYDLIRQIAN